MVLQCSFKTTNVICNQGSADFISSFYFIKQLWDFKDQPLYLYFNLVKGKQTYAKQCQNYWNTWRWKMWCHFLLMHNGNESDAKAVIWGWCRTHLSNMKEKLFQEKSCEFKPQLKERSQRDLMSTGVWGHHDASYLIFHVPLYTTCGPNLMVALDNRKLLYMSSHAILKKCQKCVVQFRH